MSILNQTMLLQAVLFISIFVDWSHAEIARFSFGTKLQGCSNSSLCNESCTTKYGAISGQCERRYSDYFEQCYCRVMQDTCEQYLTSNYVFEQCDWNPGMCPGVCVQQNYEGGHCEPHYRIKKKKFCNCYRTLQECGELDVFFKLPEEEIL